MHFSGLSQVKETISQRFLGNRDTSHLGLLLAFVLQRFDQPAFAQPVMDEEDHAISPVTKMQAPDSETLVSGLNLAEYSAQAVDLLPEEDGMQVADPGSVVFDMITDFSPLPENAAVKSMPRKANIPESEDMAEESDAISVMPFATVLAFGVANDVVNGTAYNDLIMLGAGDDIVFSSAGRDTISLGAGNDTYVLQQASHSPFESPDIITDFKPNTVKPEAQSATSTAGQPPMDTEMLNQPPSRAGDVIALGNMQGVQGESVSVTNVDSLDEALAYLLENLFDNVLNIAFDRSSQVAVIDSNDDGQADSGLLLQGVDELTDSAFSLLKIDIL